MTNISTADGRLTVEFALRLQVLANGSQTNRYGRSKQRRAENEVAWWELKRGGLVPWSKANPGPWRVRLVRLAPQTLDTGNLWYALKGVQDVVAELLGLKSDAEGEGAYWTVAQERTEFLKRNGRKYGDYRVRVELTSARADGENA